MIHFQNVNKCYENGRVGLAKATFYLKKGEMAFLTGHSGAGKSTLLKLIMRMETPTAGQITFDGKNLADLRLKDVPYLRRKIGMIFQNPHLLPAHTIFENVALPLVINDISRSFITKRTHAALDKVGLLDKINAYPQELSMGEQQRVGIARAIVNKPPLLLADEPTGNLDPILATEIMQLFTEFNNLGVTILIATHDLALIAKMPYRILVLKQGQIAGKHDTQIK